MRNRSTVYWFLAIALIVCILLLFRNCRPSSGLRKGDSGRPDLENGTNGRNEGGSRNAGNTISVCSWNLGNFGNSKTDREIAFIADLLKQYDVVAMQEIVAGPGGPKSVARLMDALNRKGAQWDYTISDPTTGSSYKSERYAFAWKPSKLRKVGDAWLEQQYQREIDREPYLATFRKNDKVFTLVSFHAITKDKQPETEIKYFRFLPGKYTGKNLIFTGDFNCPQSHSVFTPLRQMGYKPILVNQKTSLKRTCNGKDCLASEFDNMYYDKSRVKPLRSEVVHFYRSFRTFKDALRVSDHAPIVLEFSLN